MVHLIGVVQTAPTVQLNDETKIPEMVVLYLMVTTAARKYVKWENNQTPQLVPVRVRATLEDTAIPLAKAKPNDIVFLKGVLSTRNVDKQVRCQNCGEVFSVNGNAEEDGAEDENGQSRASGMLTYVTPTAVDVRGMNFSAEEAEKYLISLREMSNEIQLIGNLCADPTQWENGRATAYQLGVNRKFFQRTDDPSIVADYPYIRSYGDQAANDIEALHKSSSVMIDGFLKMRQFNRQSVCPYCGATRNWADYVLEAVPYSVEYLANYKTGEERAAEKQAAIDDSENRF